MKIIITAILLSFAIMGGLAQTETWYQLTPGQTYVSDFELTPGAIKELTIHSEKTVTVGFSADISAFASYKDLQTQYNGEVFEMIDLQTGSVLTTVSGGSLDLLPADGKINVLFKNLIDKSMTIVVYTKDVDPAQVPLESLAEVGQFNAQGAAEFKKEGWALENGRTVKQNDAIVSVNLAGVKSDAKFEFFMSKECFDEKTFSNTPGIVVMPNIINKTAGPLSYGYRVEFLDANKSLVGRLLDADELTNKHLNLSLENIEKIRFYKITYFEAPGPLSEALLLK